MTERAKVGGQFKNTPYESKIRQIFADSAALDFSKLGGPFDLAFIDGCHFREYVRKDTESADFSRRDKHTARSQATSASGRRVAEDTRADRPRPSLDP